MFALNVFILFYLSKVIRKFKLSIITQKAKNQKIFNNFKLFTQSNHQRLFIALLLLVKDRDMKFAELDGGFVSFLDHVILEFLDFGETSVQAFSSSIEIMRFKV